MTNPDYKLQAFYDFAWPKVLETRLLQRNPLINFFYLEHLLQCGPPG